MDYQTGMLSAVALALFIPWRLLTPDACLSGQNFRRRTGSITRLHLRVSNIRLGIKMSITIINQPV